MEGPEIVRVAGIVGATVATFLAGAWSAWRKVQQPVERAQETTERIGREVIPQRASDDHEPLWQSIDNLNHNVTRVANSLDETTKWQRELTKQLGAIESMTKAHEARLEEYGKRIGAVERRISNVERHLDWTPRADSDPAVKR